MLCNHLGMKSIVVFGIMRFAERIRLSLTRAIVWKKRTYKRTPRRQAHRRLTSDPCARPHRFRKKSGFVLCSRLGVKRIGVFGIKWFAKRTRPPTTRAFACRLCEQSCFVLCNRLGVKSLGVSLHGEPILAQMWAAISFLVVAAGVGAATFFCACSAACSCLRVLHVASGTGCAIAATMSSSFVASAKLGLRVERGASACSFVFFC